MNRIKLMEIVQSYQVKKINRRQFMKQAAAILGTAAAANSLLAACAQFPNETAPPVLEATQPATEPGITNEGGVSKGVVQFTDANQATFSAYLARPTDNQQPKPAVIVIQEWWGLNDHIKSVADRFAAAGFVALAPDLYHGQVATEPDEARKLAMELVADEAVAEIEAGIAYLQASQNISPKVGVVGFCMGGGLVLKTALSSDQLSAGIVFYGSPLAAADAAQVKAPIMTFLGTADRIPTNSVQAMHDAFTEAGIENIFHLYDGAQHSFFNDTRSSYHPEAAADAWEHALAWFSKHTNNAPLPM